MGKDVLRKLFPAVTSPSKLVKSRLSEFLLTITIFTVAFVVGCTMLNLPQSQPWPAIQYSSEVDKEWQRMATVKPTPKIERSVAGSTMPSPTPLTTRKPNPPPVPITNLTYTWDYTGDGWIFDFVSSTNYAVPLKLWKPIATNVFPPITVGVTNAQRFYTVHYSNTIWPGLTGWIAKQ